MLEPRLFIFDCDGVLVDSELIACETVSLCLEAAGISLPVEEVVRSYMGVSATTMICDLVNRFPSRLPRNFQEILRVRTRDAFDRELRAMQGIEEMLAVIKAPICVASSSTRERVLHSLEITGLARYFHDKVFSATQVAHGKPAPDLFLFAAEQMSVSPSDCLVIEDSIAGVQAAYAAGMRVIGFTGGSHCQPGHAQRLHEAGAMTTLERMADFPAALSNMS